MVLALLTRRIALPHAIAISAGGAALLLTVIGLLTVELVGFETADAYKPASPVAEDDLSLMTVKQTQRDDGWQLMIEGPPGERVAISQGSEALGLVDLDESGHARIEDLSLLEKDQPLELTLLLSPTLSITPAAGKVLTPVTTRPPAPTATPETRIVVVLPSPTAASPAQSTPSVQPTPSRQPSPRPSPPTSISAPPVLHLVTDAGPRLAITFDGGSSSRGTTELLALLRKMKLPVTMFLTGEFIERDPYLVRQALLDGHEIGNHTYTHPHLTSYATNRRHNLLPHVDQTWFKEELRRTEAAFFRATGRRMAPLWRAPYGEESKQLRGWALELGYLHVGWSSLRGASLDSRDWIEDEHSSLYQDPRKTMQRLMAFPRLEGGVILMHVTSARDTPMWRVLPELVDKLGSRSIETVKVSTLLDNSKVWRQWLTTARRNHRQPSLSGEADLGSESDETANINATTSR
ncbi:MAG: polysaccharide deacetylase family protein [bacterium]|nr:polysaccharide deacetylase family protein [bacterium]